MAVRTGDPWGQEGSFENMTKKAGTVVQKATSDVAKAVIADIKEQTGIEQGQVSQTQQVTQVNQEDQAKTEQEKQKVLNDTRGNLQRINQEIEKVRRERLQKEKDKNKAEMKKKQEVKQEDQKKNEEPMWKRFMRKGSHEGLKKMGA